MRMVGRTARAALLATLFATVLSSCAGARKAGPAEAEARAEELPSASAPGPPVRPSPRRSRARGRARRAGGRVAGPRQGSPEVERQARAQFSQRGRLQALGDLDGAAAAFEAARRSGAELPWAGFNAGVLQERLGQRRPGHRGLRGDHRGLPGLRPGGAEPGAALAAPGEAASTRWSGSCGTGWPGPTGWRCGSGWPRCCWPPGKHAAAEEECKKALKADEKNVPAMVALANAYAARKRYELARMVLENARQVDEADPAIWNRLGFVEMALGNRPQAIEHFKAAAALRPDYPEAHANYGAILADADDFAGAAQELELAVKYAPRSAGAWLDLGNAYRGLQEFEKAEAAYQKALALDPALNDARFNLAVLYLDVAKPGLPTLQRLEQGLGWFDEFEKNGGKEPRVARLPQGHRARDRPREEAAGARGEGPAPQGGRGGRKRRRRRRQRLGRAPARPPRRHPPRRRRQPPRPAAAQRRRRQVKGFRSLVALSGAMLTIPMAAPVPRSQRGRAGRHRPPGRARRPRPRRSCGWRR